MRYRDFIQNITITFLALLSLFLFSRTQFFQLALPPAAAPGSGSPLLSATRSPMPLLRYPVCPGAGGRHRRIRPVRQHLPHHGQRELHPHQNTAAGGSWVCPQPDGFQCCRLPVGFRKTVSLL